VSLPVSPQTSTVSEEEERSPPGAITRRRDKGKGKERVTGASKPRERERSPHSVGVHSDFEGPDGFCFDSNFEVGGATMPTPAATHLSEREDNDGEDARARPRGAYGEEGEEDRRDNTSSEARSRASSNSWFQVRESSSDGAARSGVTEGEGEPDGSDGTLSCIGTSGPTASRRTGVH